MASDGSGVPSFPEEQRGDATLGDTCSPETGLSAEPSGTLKATAGK